MKVHPFSEVPFFSLRIYPVRISSPAVFPKAAPVCRTFDFRPEITTNIYIQK